MQIKIHATDERGNILTLQEPLTITWQGRFIAVPQGFESDGVSTPRFLWATISPAIDNRTIRAGIAHDYIYRTQPQEWTRQDADDMFYDLCREDGLSWFTAQKAYWGLRLFGGSAWEENKKIKEDIK